MSGYFKTRSLSKWSKAILALLLAACSFQFINVSSALADEINIETTYSQLDPRWSSKKYGFNPNLTIRSDGCALTSLAMLLTYHGHDVDPTTLNNYMKAESLYAYDSYTKYNDLVIWRAADRFSGNEVRFNGMYSSGALDPNNEIKSGRPVIIQVHNNYVSMHFVLCYGTGGKIVDPLGGVKTTLSEKGYVADRYLLFSGEVKRRAENNQGKQSEKEGTEDNKIILSHGGWVRATIINSEAAGDAEFGKTLPNSFSLFNSAKTIGLRNM